MHTLGNYAGRPLEILWALLTLLTAGATVTGFVVWLKRHRRSATSTETTPEASALKLIGEKA